MGEKRKDPKGPANGLNARVALHMFDIMERYLPLPNISIVMYFVKPFPGFLVEIS